MGTVLPVVLSRRPRDLFGDRIWHPVVGVAMNKQDCRVGMVVHHHEFDVKCVVVKCNPKKARVRTIEDMKSSRRGSKSGSLWNMPYSSITPVVSGNLKTEMTMRSFGEVENPGIKTYFLNTKADEPVNFQEDSPEWHMMRAVCELWRRLDDESLELECEKIKAASENTQRPSTIIRNLRAEYSDKINRLFGILGREVSQDAAFSWESGNIESKRV